MVESRENDTQCQNAFGSKHQLKIRANLSYAEKHFAKVQKAHATFRWFTRKPRARIIHQEPASM